MFRFADLNRVIWPVAIGEATFRVDFDIFDRKQLRARQQRGLKGALDRIATDGAPKTPDDIAALLEATHQREDADEAELLRRVRGWYDIEDPDGQPLAFSTDRLQALLDTPYGFTALLQGLLEASRAGPVKNLSPGPGGMPERDQA